MQSLSRRLAAFALVMLVCGGLEAIVAYGLVGVRGVEGVCYSVLLCLIPGLLTIYVGELMRNADLGAYVVLIGTGFRLLFVLLGVFVVCEIRAGLGFREFTVWLIFAYLVSLAFETWMVLLPSQVESTK